MNGNGSHSNRPRCALENTTQSISFQTSNSHRQRQAVPPSPPRSMGNARGTVSDARPSTCTYGMVMRTCGCRTVGRCYGTKVEGAWVVESIRPRLFLVLARRPNQRPSRKGRKAPRCIFACTVACTLLPSNKPTLHGVCIRIIFALSDT